MKHRQSKLAISCALMSLWLISAPSAALAQGNSDAAKTKEAVLTKAPKLIKQVEATYPEDAVKTRVEGTVRLKITISAQGEVSEAEIIDGPQPLQAAALAAIRQFKFEPAEVNDEPAPVTLTFSINFALPPQPASFKGVILAQGTKAPMPGATITLRGKQEIEGQRVVVQLQSDERGEFVMEGLPAGEYEVEIAASQYAKYATSITLVEGGTSQASYTIEALPPSVRARVVERGTRTPLAGIKVELFEPLGEKVLQETYSDGEGYFIFRGLPPASYDIRVSAKGYNARRFKENLKPNTVLEGDFYIEPEVYNEYSGRTTTRRDDRDLSRRTLGLEEIRKIPGTNGDVVRVVQNLPGVARPRFLSGEVVVRGAAPQDTQVFLAQDNVPSIFHFLLGPAVINSEMIDSIDFYPGNFNVQYGRATAGIINLNTRSPREDRLRGYAKVDLLDTTLMLEGPITEDLSFAVSVRRSYVDFVIDAVLDDDADTLVAPRYWDYQAWLTYKGLADHTFELMLYGSDDKLALLSSEEGEEDIEEFGFSNFYHRGQLRWKWRPKGPLSNDFMASFGVNGTRLNGGDFFFDNRLIQSVIRNDTRVKLDESLELRFGLDFQLGRTNVDFVVPERQRQSRTPGVDDGTEDNVYGDDLSFLSSLRDQAVLSPAFYADVLYKPWEGAEVIPGLRMDYYGTLARASFAPRLNLRQRFNPQWTLKGGVGSFTQAPQLVYTNKDFGTQGLKPEQSIQYAAGVEWRPVERLLIDVTGFYRDMRDLVVQDVKIFVVDDEIDFTLYSNAGRGRAMGAEVLIKRDLTDRLFGWVAYTLSRSERLNLTTKEYDLYRNDQTHILTVVAGYKFPYGIDLSARFRLVTGFPNTPVVDRVYDVDKNNFEPIYAQPNSGREPAFHQLDMRLDKTFVFDLWTLSTYLDVINVYNQKNIEASYYSYDYTEQRTISGIPFFPTLGIIARF